MNSVKTRVSSRGRPSDILRGIESECLSKPCIALLHSALTRTFQIETIRTGIGGRTATADSLLNSST
ncbi:hypothetical protein Ac2012v2_007034 [Leucoagaricus gongylophorus]